MFNTIFQTSNGITEICENHSLIIQPIEFREMFHRYTTDVIVSCAFGLDCNTLQNKNLEFRHFGKN